MRTILIGDCFRFQRRQTLHLCTGCSCLLDHFSLRSSFHRFSSGSLLMCHLLRTAFWHALCELHTPAALVTLSPVTWSDFLGSNHLIYLLLWLHEGGDCFWGAPCKRQAGPPTSPSGWGRRTQSSGSLPPPRKRAFVSHSRHARVALLSLPPRAEL